LDVLNHQCKKEGIPLPEAAYRWLANHSFLDKSKGDGIIIGASKVNQLEQNISANEKGELPKSIVKAFEEAWNEAKPDSPEYFRFIPSNN
jgi:aflatoxin B1 aldehyde reductase